MPGPATDSAPRSVEQTPTDGSDLPTPHAAPTASVADTVRLTAGVLLPLAARGLLIRRPSMVAAAERLDVDRRAVALLADLRTRYAGGPVVLRLAGRRIAVVLDPRHAREVLERSPTPFTPASHEKRAALRHFQPHGVLISGGPERSDRRRFNEEVLDASTPVHHHAAALLGPLREEAAALRDVAGGSGRLDWDRFIHSWFRMVRRLVLGEGAADDHVLTDLLARLRADANWAYARPRRQRVRGAFDARLLRHLQRAEAGSLAELVASVPASGVTVPHQQVPQWLFAFDAAGMAAFRTLALLSAHPEVEGRVRTELADREVTDPQGLPVLRAAVLDGLRLWPTTPAILRDTVEATRLGGTSVPAGTAVLVFAPLFHRDPALPEADRFAPDLWLGGGRPGLLAVPFSAGPASCPGRNLALTTASAFLAVLLAGHRYRLDPPDRLDAARPMPGVLAPYGLAFTVDPSG